METWGNPDTNRTAVTNLMGFDDTAIKRDRCFSFIIK
jgi:hypothetical protein